MIEQNPIIRLSNFKEVNCGFSEEQAIIEANRCLQCARPLCIEGCPVNIDIPGFIKYIKDKQFKEAISLIKNYNILPAICGRVCPQEVQCEERCILGKRGEPIAIGALERFVADWEKKNKLNICPDCQSPNRIKVAIIGSGPAGLTCAADLAKYGYDITIYEAFHTGGGVLIYGIPEFRLPKTIVKEEIETLQILGVKIQYNTVIGKLYTFGDLRNLGFKAFFISVGAGLPILLNNTGIELIGVLSANEFLTRANLMKAYNFPDYDTPINIGKYVSVIGGGNVAMDSARVALRLGAEKVTIVYRRSEKEMPARKEEIYHGKEEGVEFLFLTDPLEFLGDENGKVKEMRVRKMQLGDLDESGRSKPIPIEGSEYIIKTDMIIVAIGTRANPILTNATPELNLNKLGYIETNERGQTNIKDIFAGGDIVTGSATVISAMGAGRIAANAINEYLLNSNNLIIKE
ncbi:MAG: NADPH-dependent glutamate synthase [Candidatus Lokiarchaeota archaeon]|nr:NADPH-dependent glutamate synthase [Candidatus Lokiarchaeota archaeon]